MELASNRREEDQRKKQGFSFAAWRAPARTRGKVYPLIAKSYRPLGRPDGRAATVFDDRVGGGGNPPCASNSRRASEGAAVMGGLAVWRHSAGISTRFASGISFGQASGSIELTLPLLITRANFHCRFSCARARAFLLVNSLTSRRHFAAEALTGQLVHARKSVPCDISIFPLSRKRPPRALAPAVRSRCHRLPPLAMRLALFALRAL